MGWGQSKFSRLSEGARRATGDSLARVRLDISSVLAYQGTWRDSVWMKPKRTLSVNATSCRQKISTKFLLKQPWPKAPQYRRGASPLRYPRHGSDTDPKGGGGWGNQRLQSTKEPKAEDGLRWTPTLEGWKRTAWSDGLGAGRRISIAEKNHSG